MIRGPEPRSTKLARRLADMSRRRSTEEPPASFDPLERTMDPIGVEEILPGGELESGLGRVFLHERFRSSIEQSPGRWAKPRRGRRATVRPGPGWMWEEDPNPWRWDLYPETGRAPIEPIDDLAPEVLHEELERLLRVPFERVLYLDLETGGLGSSCVFLAGTMRWTGRTTSCASTSPGTTARRGP